MLTEQDVRDFFKTMEQEAEDDAKKAFAAAGSFLRSTYAALMKDPAVLAAIHAGFDGALAAVMSAVETGGAGCLPAAALAAGRNLVISAGGTAEHALIPIVAGELHAALSAATAATPEKQNP